MNRQVGFRRLVKKVGNAVTVLWQDTVEYTIGQTYNLTIGLKRFIGKRFKSFLFNLVK
jgi:hypothetical protein